MTDIDTATTTITTNPEIEYRIDDATNTKTPAIPINGAVFQDGQQQLDDLRKKANDAYQECEKYYTDSRSRLYDALVYAYQFHVSGTSWGKDLYQQYLKTVCGYEVKLSAEKKTASENDTIRALFKGLKDSKQRVSQYAAVLKWFQYQIKQGVPLDAAKQDLQKKGISAVREEISQKKPDNWDAKTFFPEDKDNSSVPNQPEKTELRIAVLRVSGGNHTIVRIAEKADDNALKSIRRLFK